MTTPVWKTEPNRLTWYDDYTGLRCHIVRHPDGHLCGFVRIPGKFASKFSRKVPDIKHWLFHDLDLTPHVGVTLYSIPQPKDGTKKEKGRWIGFECDNYFDYSPYSPQKGQFEDNYKTMKYVKSEVRNLAAKLHYHLHHLGLINAVRPGCIMPMDTPFAKNWRRSGTVLSVQNRGKKILVEVYHSKDHSGKYWMRPVTNCYWRNFQFWKKVGKNYIVYQDINGGPYFGLMRV